MKRAFPLAIASVLAGGLVVVSASALAQNPAGTAEGKGFAAVMQPKALAAAASSDTTIVPKGGEDVSGLEAYYDNPAALRSAGQGAAASSDLFGLSGAASANAATSTVSDADSWLSRSFSIANDPNAELGTTSGDEAQTCTPGTTTRTITSTSLYTCESGQAVTESEGSCVAQLRVETSSVYDYACTVTYDQTSRTWQISTACRALDEAASAAPPSCAKTGESCTAPAPPYFQARQCTKGDQWTSTARTCRETLIVNVDTDYLYACGSTYDQANRVWNVSSQCNALAASAPNCAFQTETCTSAATPYFTTIGCRAGTQWGIGSQTCDPVREITVRTQYVYNGERIWDGSMWAPNAAQTALQGAGASCQIQATNCTGGSSNPPTYTCRRGYTASTSNGTCNKALAEAYPTDIASGFAFTASANFRVYGPDRPGRYNAMLALLGPDCIANTLSETTGTNFIGGRNYNWSNFSGDISCRRAPVDVITVGAINSDPYTPQRVWDTRNAGNTSTSGSQGSLDVMMGRAPGPVCRFLPTNCPKTAAASAAQSNFTCRIETSYPGCSAPAGMVLQSSTCIANDGASGACSAWSDTYNDPTGGCSTWTDQWLCDAPVAGAGSPISTPKSVLSEAWSNACAAVQADPTCSKTSEVVTQGPETRTIDGLPIFRDSWGRQDTWTCAAGSAVDTCSGKAGGCTETARTCVGADASGTCSLWDYTFSCPADDGSGNCSAKSATYLCSNPVPAAGTPITTPKTVVSESWDSGCLAETSTPNCVAGAISPIGGASTRDIDGLSVTRGPWVRDRAFVCWASAPIDGCTGNVTGCTEGGRSCVSTDKDGTCTAWQYTYSCPADDGSGDCSVRTETYQCAAPVPAAEPAAKVTTSVTNMYWSAVAGECKPDFDADCATAEETCMDPGPTRVFNGVTVTAACFQKHVRYFCKAAGPVTTNCAPAPGCVLTQSSCLDDGAPSSAPCSAREQVYSCTNTSTQILATSVCSATMCLDGACFTLDPSQDNSAELGNAFAALSIAKVGGGDYASAKDLKIMGGQRRRCRKSVLGFRNCCKDSGWGISMGLAQCDANEVQLIQQQTAKACHYVGTYCSDKTFFGTCLTKAMMYCCFEGPLGRIVNEAGRPQVPKGWGTAKNPDCSGFTVAQFQLLDLSSVDFTDFYADKMAALNPPSGADTTSRIGQTLQSLYSSGSPSNLPPEIP